MVFALYKEDRGVNPITDEKISNTVTKLAKNPNKGVIMIFEENDVIIGYSILIPYWSNEYGGDIMHIDEIYVKGEHRRRGAATRFFDYVSREFKGKVVALQLEVSPSRSELIDFYRKRGFSKTKNTHLISVR
jgi:ribosomal protein S18 acetylase RimI-like enzyme